MATKKITELPALDSAGLDVSDVLAIVDISTGTTKKITKADLVGTASSGGDTLPIVDSTAVVKDPADATKLVRIDAGAVGTGTTKVITMGDRDVSLASGGTFSESAHNHSGVYEPADSAIAKTDEVNNFTKGQSGEVTPLTDAATTAIDFSDSNNFSLLTTSGIGATRKLGNPSNAVAGQSGAITITSDAASRLLTYDTNWQFEGGTAPAITTDSGGVDILAYYVESATRISAKMLKALS